MTNLYISLITYIAHSQHDEHNFKDRRDIKHPIIKNFDGKENSAQSSAQLAHSIDSFTSLPSNG
jgi:hypothetical protein